MGKAKSEEAERERIRKLKESIRKGYENGRKPWNFNLTKETDVRVKSIGIQNSKKYKGKTWEDICGKEVAKKRRENNPTKRPEVREKISNTVSSMWKDPNSIFNSNEYRNKLRGRKNNTKPHTEETKKKMGIKCRESAIKRIEREKLAGNPLTPCIGRYERKTLDILEECFEYKIERQKRIAGYFVDGYCSVLNLVIEIDESHHRDQIMKDKIREENIKKELNCQFLRIAVGGN